MEKKNKYTLELMCYLFVIVFAIMAIILFLGEDKTGTFIFAILSIISFFVGIIDAKHKRRKQ